MKKVLYIFSIVLFTFISIIFASENIALAYTQSSDSLEKELALLEGDWYDPNGDLILAIHNGYINGCKVVNGLNFAGCSQTMEGYFRIIEATGYKDLQLELSNCSLSNPHANVILDKKYILHRNLAPAYFESVGGIYIGMSKHALINLYGIPEKYLSPTETDTLYGIKRPSWKYKEGLVIIFDHYTQSEVQIILILKNGTRHLDRTGFNCFDSLEAYKIQYNMSQLPLKGAFRGEKIYEGEYLWFDNYPNIIMLSNGCY